jgi:hypothetical protein
MTAAYKAANTTGFIATGDYQAIPWFSIIYKAIEFLVGTTSS